MCECLQEVLEVLHQLRARVEGLGYGTCAGTPEDNVRTTPRGKSEGGGEEGEGASMNRPCFLMSTLCMPCWTQKLVKPGSLPI